MATELERTEHVTRLLPGAAAGDRSAATELLGALVEPDRQAAALAALSTADSQQLWLHLLEFLATNRWLGAQLSLPLGIESWRQKLRMRLHALLALHHDPASDAAREAALIEALHHRLGEVRAAAADLLGERRTGQARDALVAALDDPKGPARVHAARALGALGDSAAVAPLARCLANRQDGLAGATVEALARIGAASLPALVEACRSRDEWVRWHAARGLGRMHDARAVALLVGLFADDDPTVRWMAVQALERHGAAGIEPLLLALVAGPITPEFAHAAGHVVRRVRDPKLAAILRPLGAALRHAHAAATAPLLAEQALVELSRTPPDRPDAPPSDEAVTGLIHLDLTERSLFGQPLETTP